MNYDEMHWTQIKKLVEERGGEYVGKPEALLFLNSETNATAQTAAIEDVPAKAVTFDKSQPYGEVSGDVDGAPGARFTQGGLYFNNKGVKVG